MLALVSYAIFLSLLLSVALINACTSSNCVFRKVRYNIAISNVFLNFELTDVPMTKGSNYCIRMLEDLLLKY